MVLNNLAVNIWKASDLDLILYYFVYNDHWSQQCSPIFSVFFRLSWKWYSYFNWTLRINHGSECQSHRQQYCSQFSCVSCDEEKAEQQREGCFFTSFSLPHTQHVLRLLGSQAALPNPWVEIRALSVKHATASVFPNIDSSSTPFFYEHSFWIRISYLHYK